MSLIDEFGDVMNQLVLIESWTGSNGYDDIFSEGQLHPCYVEEEVKLIRKADGSEVVSMAQLFLDGSVSVRAEDRVTFNGRTCPIQQIGRNVDEDGDPYSVIIYL